MAVFHWIMLRTEARNSSNPPTYDLRGPWNLKTARDAVILDQSDFWNQFDRLTFVPFDTEGRKLDVAQQIGKESVDRAVEGGPQPQQVQPQIDTNELIGRPSPTIGVPVIGSVVQDFTPNIDLNENITKETPVSSAPSAVERAEEESINNVLPESLEDTARGFGDDSHSLLDDADSRPSLEDAAGGLRATSFGAERNPSDPQINSIQTALNVTEAETSDLDDLENDLKKDLDEQIDEGRAEQDQTAMQRSVF